MLNCENCCYCGYGKSVRCPFYQRKYEPLDIYSIEKAANKEQEASLYWATCRLYGYRTDKNERKAISTLKKLSHKGYTPAQYVLSLCYFNGIHVSKKTEEAFELCKQAARNGCNLAEIQLYHCYRDGIGVKRDLKQARKWCGNAAHHDSSEVYYEYARMCCLPEYGEYQRKEACEFYKRALENGKEEARACLVELHKNYPEDCFTGYMLHDSSLAYSCYMDLGDFCLENAYSSNVEKALENYRKAQKEVMKEKEAMNGNDRYSRNLKEYDEYFSRLCMGVSHKEEKNRKKIEKCYTVLFSEPANVDKKPLYESALSGNAEDQYRLGCILDDRASALYNHNEAMEWFSLSAAQGNKSASSRIRQYERTSVPSVEYGDRTYGYDTQHVSFERERTFGGTQVEDHKIFLEKQLSGTLTPEERDEYDRRWV